MKRVQIIELLRGVGALMVAISHIKTQNTYAIWQFITNRGFLGLDVFYVISGFVVPFSLVGIGYSLRRFPRFMARRMVRLEPAYLLSVAAAIFLWELASLTPWYRGVPPNWTWLQLAAHLFYLIPLTSYQWLQPVYGSLAYEFVFYIVVGLTFAFLIGRHIAFTFALGVGAVIIMFGIRGSLDEWVPEFLVGALLMRFCIDRKKSILFWLALALAISFASGGLARGAVTLLTVCAVYFFRTVEFGRPALFFGAISYSLYLLHDIVGTRVTNLGLRFGSGPAYETALVIFSILVSVAAATAFWWAVDRVCVAASRKIALTEGFSIAVAAEDQSGGKLTVKD